MQYGNKFPRISVNLRGHRFKSYYVVWKPTANDGRYHQHIRLNRTMQYGNTEKRRTAVRFTFGLNRTMQYGNATKRASAVPIPIAFKSYYVVWKLFFTLQHFFHHRWFKSYYVVWKPRLSLPEHFRPTVFKSYYVVWKHTRVPPRGRISSRLNRTMQYGNL